MECFLLLQFTMSSGKHFYRPLENSDRLLKIWQWPRSGQGRTWVWASERSQGSHFTSPCVVCAENSKDVCVCVPKQSRKSRLGTWGACYSSARRFSRIAHACAVPETDQKLALGFIWKPHCSQNFSSSPGSCRRGGSLASSEWDSPKPVPVSERWTWARVKCRLCAQPPEVVHVCVWQHLPGNSQCLFPPRSLFSDSCVRR